MMKAIILNELLAYIFVSMQRLMAIYTRVILRLVLSPSIGG